MSMDIFVVFRLFLHIWKMEVPVVIFVLMLLQQGTTFDLHENVKHMSKPSPHNQDEFGFFVENNNDAVVKQLSNENFDTAVSTIKFKNDIQTTGWSHLEVNTNSLYNNSMQAYAAGYAEGYVTKDMIDDRIENELKDFCKTPSIYCTNLNKYLETNLKYMLSMVNSNPYWEQIYYILLQLQGLEDGYNRQKVDLSIRLKPFGMFLLNVDGDLESLETALNGTSENVLGSGSCSALIKILPGFKDLYAAHDTWTTYSSMLRIMKKYTMNFKDAEGKPLPGHTSSFSSGPGRIYSGDDFYILSSGLVSIETTIGNSNSDLWKYVTPEDSVLEGFRNMAANRMAKNGEEWCEIFSIYNSGTYNNQWMILDYNKFTPGQKPTEEGLLYLLEQIPGTIEYKDVSNVFVNQMYWPSYNCPYFKSIFEKSGTAAMEKKYGNWFSYDKTPRALIFARNQSQVSDLSHMIKLMRYNNFKHDPLSACNCTPPYSSENTIAARCDLNPQSGQYPIAALGFRNHGATDVKVTSSEMIRKYEMVAECGPTHDQQPVFVWSESPFAHLSHRGMPDRYDFEPVHVTWN
uniref:Phospholipase B-like n=1 Tax=Phallusia mammillata TaxID=59560 RepID=A0A6F9DPM0_9ASCI|nr:putative phospholipase B-like 2 [Phallusia mammillata]